MNRFESKSATRVDFAGGTLDLWPLSTLIEGATTLNCSISCYTSVSFQPGEQFSLFVESPDFSENFSFESLETFKQAEDPKFSLLQQALSAFSDDSKALGYWELKSESPAGSGLGGSSSLLISILKVIFAVEDKAFTEREIIETAKNIESRVLKTPAGIQDYFAPVEEGLNHISYFEDGFRRVDFSEVLSFWKPCFTIVDSQIKHHSGMNNWEILKAYIDADTQVVGALNEIALVSAETAKAISEKNYENLAACFKRELEARKKVSSSYINDELQLCIDKILNIDSVGAAKVCGAGGGGCVLILHKSESSIELKKNLADQGLHVLPFELTGSI